MRDVSCASSTGPRAKPRAFSHPAWWLALVVLLVNDHFLKGSGLLPPLLTGKLSDFAGLIVAPALLALVWPSEDRRQRSMFSSSAVACAFAAINMFPAASQLLEQLLQCVWSGARLWADPTDLLALVVLPVGYWLCLPDPHPDARRAGVRTVERLAVGLGAMACVATAGFGDDDKKNNERSDAPQVHNATGEALLLVVSSTEGAGGCDLYRNRRAEILTTDAFTERREVALEDDERTRMVADVSTATCGAAWLQLPDGQQEFVYWRDLEKIEDYVASDDERRENRRVRIEGEPGRYRVVLGDDIERFEPGGEVAESTCEGSQPRYDLSWTRPPIEQGFLELAEVSRDDDGCLLLSWSPPPEGELADAGMAEPQQLCVPPWAFAFDAGDLLSIVELPVEGGGERIRFTRFDDDRPQLQLEVWHEASDFEGSLVESAEPEDCFGELAECGAYLRPLAITVRGEKDPLGAGDQATVSAGDPEETRILVGAARDVGWSAADCREGEGRSGPSASLLELRSF